MCRAAPKLGAIRWLCGGWLLCIVLGALCYPTIETRITRFLGTETHPCLANRPPGALAIPRSNARLSFDAGEFERVAGADRQLSGRELSGYFVEQQFSKADRDANGELEFDEFRRLRLAGTSEFRRRQFDTLDDDRSESLSNVEATAVLMIFPEAEAVDWLRRYDLDESRTLSAAEFVGFPVPQSYLFGSDSLGRDVFARTLRGARISLLVGLLGTAVALLIGVLWGATAGFVGGRVDDVMMRTVDVLYGLPYMFIVILLTVMFGRSLFLLFVAIGAVSWLTMARIVRGRVLTVASEPFVEAATALGASKFRLLGRHIIPQTTDLVITYAALTVPAVMLQEAFLSFLGLGVQAPLTSWGAMASDAASVTVIVNYPWQILAPGLAFSLTLLSLNVLANRRV